MCQTQNINYNTRKFSRTYELQSHSFFQAKTDMQSPALFSNFVYFCSYFQIFCPFKLFPFFEKLQACPYFIE